jgi:general secretion pathway protein D
MGVQWPNRLTLSPLPSSGEVVTLKDLGNITSGTTRATIADMILNLNKETGLVNTLANPRIRSQNRQKANILIGNKVPVVTTTATATGFASQSVQYLDVGLKLEIEPSIHLQDEVEIKLALEVSNIVNQLVVGDVLTYEIGTRNAAATLRMKDGETQVLSVLINDNDTRNSAGIPGLGDIPVVGRLFRSQRDVKDKTEIVLLITPHLVRNVSLPDATASEFLSGSEVNPRGPRALAAGGSPAAAARAATATDAGGGGGPRPRADGKSQPPVMPAEAAGVRLALSGPASAKVGDQFKLAVSMRADSPVHSAPMELHFDPALLQVVDVAEGGFFRQGKGRSNFAHQVDAARGLLILGAARDDAAGSSGEAPVATITFRAKAPGARAEVRLDSVTAITPDGGAATVSLPPPFSLTLAN